MQFTSFSVSGNFVSSRSPASIAVSVESRHTNAPRTREPDLARRRGNSNAHLERECRRKAIAAIRAHPLGCRLPCIGPRSSVDMPDGLFEQLLRLRNAFLHLLSSFPTWLG